MQRLGIESTREPGERESEDHRTCVIEVRARRDEATMTG